jgi:hypothetical protein
MIPMRHQSIFSTTFSAPLMAALLLGLCLVLIPQVAFADPNAEVARLLEQAEEDYDMIMFDEAKEAIEEGLAIVDREGLRTEEAAGLYMLLGIIRHADGDDSLAEDAFVRAVETYEEVEINPFYRTPALEEILERAQARAEPPPVEPDEPADTVIGEEPPEDEVEPLRHSPMRRADAGEDLMFVADIPADLPVFRVFISHRRYGESDFEQTEMDPTDATGFAFTLEGSQVRTSQLEYFITAVSRSGDVLAESGRRTNPHRISVIGDTGDRHVATTDPDDELEREPREPRDDIGFFASLYGGTDVGFLPGGTAPTANIDRSVSPGLAPAFAHTTLNLGWRITEHNNLGLYFRWQFSPPQDFSALPADRFDDGGFWQSQQECFGMGLPGDCLLGLKYERIISAGTPEFYSSVGFGIGRIRNWLRLKQATDEEPEQGTICYGREIRHDAEAGPYCQIRDTVRTGWVHFGVGGGMYFPIIDNLDFVADTYLMVLVPDTSINLDFNVGLRFTL